jgi:hypothetical protein
MYHTCFRSELAFIMTTVSPSPWNMGMEWQAKISPVKSCEPYSADKV